MRLIDGYEILCISSHLSTGSHVIFCLQETRQYKVISVDNYHNSFPKSLDRVAQIARDNLPKDATEQDKDSAEIESIKCDLTKPDEIKAIFEKYGKGGIWGVVHIAVRGITSFQEILFMYRSCLRPTKRSESLPRSRCSIMPTT